MTVQLEIPSNTFTASDDTLFTTDFFIYDKANLDVFINETLISPLLYEVISNSGDNGSVVQFYLPVTGEVRMTRDTTKERVIDYNNTVNSITPSTLNFDFDRLWRSIQELGYEDERIRQILEDLRNNGQVHTNADWLATSGPAFILNKPETFGVELGETDETAYRGDRGKIAYDHSQTTGNPHMMVKEDIGLGNVDNTSDLDKPISTATQTALDNKLSELQSVSTTGTSLINTKIGTLGQVKKLAINDTNNNLTITDNGTYVTLDTNGNSVKYFSEGVFGSQIYWYGKNLTNNILFVSGRHTADNTALNVIASAPSFTLFNPVHTQKASYSIGNGSIDLQILRRTDVTDDVSSGNYALGGYNNAGGSNSGVVGYNVNQAGSFGATFGSGLGRVSNNGNNTLLINCSLESTTPTTNGATGLYPVTSSATSSLIVNRAASTFGGSSGGNFSGSHHLAFVGGGSIAGAFNTVMSNSYGNMITGSYNILQANNQSVLADRGMINISVLSIRPALNNQLTGGNSIIKQAKTCNFSNTQGGVWRYLTASENGDQANLTTQTFKMHPTSYTCYFESIIKVKESQTISNIYKLVGYTYQTGGTAKAIAYTVTTILEQSTAGYIELRAILEATDYIRIQAKINYTGPTTPANQIAAIEAYTTYTELGA